MSEIGRRDGAVSPLGHEALDLAAKGWAVFPCREHGDGAKAPYTLRGFKDATTDADVIRWWWGRWPEAMIGASVPSSVVVFDIDPRKGGSYEALVERFGALPETLTAWSGRCDGGRHLYFRRPPGTPSSRNVPPGIDLKVNGYCIVPPSIHPETGLPYVWEEREVADLPPAAVAALCPRSVPGFGRQSVKSGDGSHLVRWLDRFPVHGINNALYWAACRAEENGILEDLYERLIAKAVELGESEPAARRTVESARHRLGDDGGVR
jgi:hypothetical protein